MYLYYLLTFLDRKIV